MRLLMILLCAMLCSSVALQAQMQNNNWCGPGGGISFSPSITTYNTGLPSISVATATVSHRTTGALLFYANTNDAYNKNFVLMPNGQDISSAFRPAQFTGNGVLQGANIVPFVNDTNKYYIFNISRNIIAPLERGVLSYSVVDMTLDGGLGDVVAGKKNIPIDSGFSTGMVITEGCDFYWLIAYKMSTGAFYAYKITAQGINTTPVVSKPTTYTNRAGRLVYIKVSPNRKKLAFTAYEWASQVQYPNDTVSFAAMHDFNALTGTISGGQLVDTINNTRGSQGLYSCEFSPDSKMLYISSFVIFPPTFVHSSVIFQYDLSRPFPAIAGMKDTVYADSLSSVWFLQMGPDSLIYSAYSGSTGNGLASISNPNAPHPACIFKPNAVVTGNRGMSTPAAVVYTTGKGPLLEINSRIDTSICLDKPFLLKPQFNATWYDWQDGSHLNQYSTSTAGTYWVRYPQTCGMLVDTFVVAPHYDTAYVDRDTIMCAGGIQVLWSSRDSASSATYKWSTGSNSKQIVILDTGKYWVTATEVCDVTIDTINVDRVDVSVTVTSNDTTICMGDTIMLSATAMPDVATIVWSNKDTAATTKASAEGRYVATVRFTGCKTEDYVDVAHYPRLLVELGEDTTICTNEPFVLPVLSSIDASAGYVWQDGSTARKYIPKETGTYHVMVTNLCGSVSDTVDIVANDCYLFFPSAFSPNGDGHNDRAHLIGDIANVGDYHIRIYNRWGQEVFFSTDVHQGWDGYFNGQPAAMGAYYYYIKYTYRGKEELKKGSVTLVR